MNRQKRKRNRGFILTHQGWQKLQKAKHESELEENYGEKLTLEELSGRTRLAYNTVAKVLARKEGVDKRTLVNLYMAFNLELNPDDYKKPDSSSQSQEEEIVPKHIDWGDAPDISFFYGRTSELATLEKWLLGDRCRLVAIIGMGGIGKTSLSVKLAKQIQNRFDYIIWRSLRDAPPLKEILANLIQFLSDEQEPKTALLKRAGKLISRLIDYLRSNRCLLILDNAETIMQSGTRAGCYRKGYEDYSQLLRRVGEVRHQSCLLLTTREKPKEVALLEGEKIPIRSLRLSGLQELEGQKILQPRSLSGNKSEWKALIECYSGNPLALKIVATTIQNAFNGNISEFLQQNRAVFSDISDLLGQQFERLSDLEHEIMYWLAINYEPVSLSQLQEDILAPVSQPILIEALESLLRRSLIAQSAARFTLQPVISEYVISRLITLLCEEIVAGLETENDGRISQFIMLSKYPIVKVKSQEYLREIRLEIILKPLLEILLKRFNNQFELENKLILILKFWQAVYPQTPGYLGGNIINILSQIKTNLSNYDFSNLTVWQADLRGLNLHNVNFTNADLSNSIFTKNFSRIASIAFSPDGKNLATSNADGQICLWREFLEEEQLLSCQGHIDWVRTIAFSENGNILVSGGNDHNLKFWDISAGKCLKTINAHTQQIRAVVFSRDGKMVASCSDDRTVRLWNVSTGECCKILRGHSDRVLSVVFSQDDKFLVSVSRDQTLRCWDVKTGESFILQRHIGCATAVAFSRNGQKLASIGDDQTLILWDVNTGQALKTLREYNSSIKSLAFSPQSNILASGSNDCSVLLWDVNTGQALKTLRGDTGCVTAVAFSQDGQKLASGSDDQTVHCWDVNTGQALKTLRGYKNGVYSVAFSRDGQKLASGSDDQTVHCYDINTGKTVTTLQGHPNRVRTVAFSPDGQKLASGSYDQTVRLWDTNTGLALRTLQGHIGWVKSVAFAPQGKILASGSDDCSVKLWNVSSGQNLRTLKHSNGVWSVAFSRDGKILASGSDDYLVRLWNVSTGKCLRIFQEHRGWVLSVVFSPDGQKLASGSKDLTIKLWNVSTGECLNTLQGHRSWITSVAFSPDGQKLASGSIDQTVKLWNVSTGECLNTLKGHTHWIRSVAFSPDGKKLASGSEDETVKLWDICKGECLKTFRGERPYEGMNITGVTGLTQTTISSLKFLGAIVQL